MRCKKFKDRVILYLYGELAPEDKEAFEKHIDQCAACREDMVYTKSVFEVIDEVKPESASEGDWAKNWKSIENTIAAKDRRKNSSFLLPRWAYAAAATVLIFALGIVAGRIWFSTPAALDLSGVREGSLQTAFNNYIADIKPLLIDFANYAESETAGATVAVDREFLRGLLFQNILLKRILTEKDPEAAQLLEDIEIVLRELKNLEPDDKRTPALIKELIQKREILFKMEILQNI
jgi:hypothetical protein